MLLSGGTRSALGGCGTVAFRALPIARSPGPCPSAVGFKCGWESLESDSSSVVFGRGNDSKYTLAGVHGQGLFFAQTLLFILLYERLIVTVERPRLSLLRDRLAKRETFPRGAVNQLPMLVECSGTMSVVRDEAGEGNGQDLCNHVLACGNTHCFSYSRDCPLPALPQDRGWLPQQSDPNQRVWLWFLTAITFPSSPHW